MHLLDSTLWRMPQRMREETHTARNFGPKQYRLKFLINKEIVDF